MGVQRLQVQFDDADGVYFPGQTVQGQVLVTIKGKIKKTRGIEVRFNGKSEVYWKEKVQQSKSSKKDSKEGEDGGEKPAKYAVFDNEETYFESRIYAFGNGSETDLPVGDHFFPFSFVLPPSLPSSFEGEFGSVRYFVKVSLLAVKKKAAKEAKGFFTVNSILDLNTRPELSNPALHATQKNVSFMLWKSGPLSAQIRLPRSGYVPGETVTFGASIDNLTKVKVSKSKLFFLQETQFHSGSKTKTHSVILAKFEKGAIKKGSSDSSWEDHSIVVPALPPSELLSCAIIDVAYKLEFHVECSGSKPLVAELPLTIGTIPFSSTFTSFDSTETPLDEEEEEEEILQDKHGAVQPAFNPHLPSAPEGGAVGGVPAAAAAASAPPATPKRRAPARPPPPFAQLYPDLAPPSYEETMRDDGGLQQQQQQLPHQQRALRTEEDAQMMDGNWDFKPKYLTYRRKKQPH